MLLKNYLNYLIILILSGVCIWKSVQNYRLIEAKKEIKLVNNKFKQKIEADSLTITYLTNLFNIKTNDEEIVLGADEIFLTTFLNKKTKVSLAGILDEKDILVIRYTEIGCHSCMDSTLNILKSNRAIVEKRYRPIILVDFNDIEDAIRWKNVVETIYPVYQLPKGELPLSVENSNSSYLFTLGKDNVVKNVFMPKNDFPDNIKKYYIGISNK